MRRLVTADEMSQLDARAQSEFSIPGLILMEHAGLAMYELLCREAQRREATRSSSSARASISCRKQSHDSRRAAGIDPQPANAHGSEARPRTLDAAPRLVVLAGRGNNGGDGLVIARLAAIDRRFHVSVVEAGCERASDDSPAAVHLASCRALGVAVYGKTSVSSVLESLGSGDWIVDAVSGTGLNGELREEFADLCESTAAAGCRGVSVFAVDVPSGIGDQFQRGFRSVTADVTACAGWLKRSLYTPAARPHAGNVHALDIRFPRQLEDELSSRSLQCGVADRSDIRDFLGRVSASAHKGERGHVAVFAGQSGTAGAALLTSAAASRSRAGLVSLYADASLAARCEGVNPAIMVHAVNDAAQAFQEHSRRVDAVLVGPGWGVTDARIDELGAITSACRRGVLDADALTLLARSFDLPSGEWIMTPHPAECARMLSIPVEDVLNRPSEAAHRVATTWGAVVILKAAATWIVGVDGSECVVDGMHRAGGTAGSGDVLAGVAAGLLVSSRTEESGTDSARRTFHTAVAAAFVHAEAIHRAFERYGWFSANELVECVGAALAGIEQR